MKFSNKHLLPRIKRRRDKELENFIVGKINEELEDLEGSNEDYDLIQVQYFLESVFDNKDERDEFLKKLQ